MALPSTCLGVHVHIHTCTCTSIHLSLYIYTHTYAHKRIHACTHTYMHLYMCIICVYTYMYVYKVSDLYLRACTYIHIQLRTLMYLRSHTSPAGGCKFFEQTAQPVPLGGRGPLLQWEAQKGSLGLSIRMPEDPSNGQGATRDLRAGRRAAFFFNPGVLPLRQGCLGLGA